MQRGASRPRTVGTIARLAVVIAAVALLLPLAAAGRPAPGGAAPGPLSIRAATSNASSWTNVTGSVGSAPPARSIAQAAYSPALNETILFGGYNGEGGNFALGDTWSFANGTWTQLSPAESPAPRWGATLVWDPAADALLLFGGRNATQFFNDTWEYNASGWHSVSTTTGPSARYDYGMAYDAALGAVVLFGGGVGNVPAGTFTSFTFFNDTWTFADGAWTNVTATAGAAPAGRLIRGQLAYDVADGAVILTGGYSYVPLGTETGCGYVEFDTNWSATWQFAGGQWSAVPVAGPTPPVGMGVVWFDAEANETLYYEGMWLDAGACDVSGNQVWSYAAGNWTLVTEGNISAPPPREQPVFVDDQGDDAQVEFGGELAGTATEYSATYLNDTWTYQPTWATFRERGAPTGTAWTVTVASAAGTLHANPIVFVEAPGDYTYTAVPHGSATAGLSVNGTFALRHGPVLVLLVFVRSPTGPGPAPAASGGWSPLDLAAAGVAVGVGLVGAVAGAAALRERRRLQTEGERLVESALDEPGPR